AHGALGGPNRTGHLRLSLVSGSRSRPVSGLDRLSGRGTHVAVALVALASCGTSSRLGWESHMRLIVTVCVLVGAVALLAVGIFACPPRAGQSGAPLVQQAPEPDPPPPQPARPADPGTPPVEATPGPAVADLVGGLNRLRAGAEADEAIAAL